MRSTKTFDKKNLPNIFNQLPLAEFSIDSFGRSRQVTQLR